MRNNKFEYILHMFVGKNLFKNFIYCCIYDLSQIKLHISESATKIVKKVITFGKYCKDIIKILREDKLKLVPKTTNRERIINLYRICNRKYNIYVSERKASSK